MITAYRTPSSPYRDSVYIAWDAAAGGSAAGGGVLVATSKDSGPSFSVVRADNPHGPGRAIGAIPFVGSNGEAYRARTDDAADTIAFSGSLDRRATFAPPAR